MSVEKELRNEMMNRPLFEDSNSEEDIIIRASLENSGQGTFDLGIVDLDNLKPVKRNPDEEDEDWDEFDKELQEKHDPLKPEELEKSIKNIKCLLQIFMKNQSISKILLNTYQGPKNTEALSLFKFLRRTSRLDFLRKYDTPVGLQALKDLTDLVVNVYSKFIVGDV